jgi:hypothetical protein
MVLPGAKVTIEERLNGTTHIRLTSSNKTAYLNFKALDTKPDRLTALNTKARPLAALAGKQNPGDITTRREQEKQVTEPATKPAASHPWRGFKLLPYGITNKYNQKIPSKKMS